MSSHCASVHYKGKFSAEGAVRTAIELRESLGRPAGLAFVFISPDYSAHIDELSDILRVDGHISDVVGCTGAGLICGTEEVEGESGFSVLVLGEPGASFQVIPLTQSMNDQALDVTAFWKKTGGASPNAWISLLNPFTFDVENWLTAWNSAYPDVPCVGGLASGDQQASECLVFANGRALDGVVVGISGSLGVIPLVSQGCRPIGEPLTVTKAENNIVYALGAKPAYEALETAFEQLTDGEKASAKGNLFAGLAGTEYVEDFKPGDFLIRNILGADPSSGAVVLGAIPRVGQTLQYQLRDRSSATDELRSLLNSVKAECGTPVASLMFACNGRGAHFFGEKSHDSSMVEKILGLHPGAGFFCSGEIGPVAARTCIHSYTLSCALIVPRTPNLPAA